MSAGGSGARADLAPGLRQWLADVNRFNDEQRRSGHRRTVAEARAALATLTATFVTAPAPVAAVRDYAVGRGEASIALRLFDPGAAPEPALILFVHGGGHVAGGVEVYDPIARRLARATKRLVAAVDYRLAPEYPYPAGLRDVDAVLRGLRGLLDAHGVRYMPRLALVGDSGGGALCASLAHALRGDLDLTVDGQVLIYPSLDYTLSLPSVARLGSGYLLERERIAWYFDRYFSPTDDRRAASPLFMPIVQPLPRTLVITADHCPLRDEGEAYVARLRAAGVDARHVELAATIHACLNLEDLMPQACARTYALIAAFLNA
ncbi:MAG: alpha/beta hydrolase [Gammaproteobacteria bacterium]|nr:alpha/beta hydrolase [Gammaproteobacteria bacterium]